MEAGGRHATDMAIVDEVADLTKADGARLKVDIGQRNGKIASFLDQYRMDKIRDLSDEQEGIIRRVVTNGMEAGHPPAKMASLVREHIGLTPYQAQQVQNYRTDLESLNITALQRERRDIRLTGNRTIAPSVSMTIEGLPLISSGLLRKNPTKYE